jgi:hypothetical protein
LDAYAIYYEAVYKELKMNKQNVIAIAEGLKQIEDGVEKIQRIMREQNIKSIKEVAAELIPMLKADDDEINESIIAHLEKKN